MKKKIMSVLVSLCMLASIFSVFSVVTFAKETGTCGENLSWTLDDNGVLTVSGTGEMYRWDSRDSVPWNGSKEKIKKVVIKEGVSLVGKYSFSYCENLKEVSFPDSLTVIEEYSFYECSRLQSVEFPKNLGTIGTSAFEGCIALKKVKIPETINWLGGYIFEYCGNLEEAIILGNPSHWSSGIFSSCEKLKTVKLSGNIEEIPQSTFLCCKSLTEIVIPQGVKRIGKGAFVRSGLTSIVIPKSVTQIDKEVFGTKTWRSKLENIYYEGSQQDWNKIDIQTSANDDPIISSVPVSYNYDLSTLSSSISTNSSNKSGKTEKSKSQPSSWAKNEVDDAIKANLVTSAVQKDYKGNITREQFCELVMKLYYKLSGNSVSVGSNKFDDTSNQEVLKANKLGIVNGVSDTKFAPNSSITRQEICTMLTRAIGAIYKDIYLEGYCDEDFNDTGKIATWANSSVMFAYHNGIMQGVGSNTIEPLGNATCEQAILLVTRIYKNRSKFDYLNKNSEKLCGNNITWSMHENGTLVISGTGKMYDYGIKTTNSSPWAGNKNIKTVFISEGITYIGNTTFKLCKNIETIYMPKSLQGIGYNCFQQCDSLEKAYFSGDKTSWNKLVAGAYSPIHNVDETFNFNYKETMASAQKLGIASLDDEVKNSEESLLDKIESGKIETTPTISETLSSSINGSYYGKISASESHSATVDNFGSLWMWGDNSDGQIGDGTNQNCTEPKKIMDDVKMVSLGTSHSVAVKKDGTLWAWGDNSDGQIGDGTNQSCTEPKKIMDDVKMVSAGYGYTVAVKKDGTLWAWGDNSDGQLGTSSVESTNNPIQVEKNVSQVYASYEFFTLIVKNDGSLWGSGNNKFGTLASSGKFGKKSYSFVKIMDDVVSASAGGYTAYAIKKDGSLWAWGNNMFGGIGVGEPSDSTISVPTKVMDDVKHISAVYHAVAIKKDGSLWVWGDNYDGQLGCKSDSTSSEYNELASEVVSKPTKIAKNAEYACAGVTYSLTIKSDGKLYSWGHNDYGQIGNGEKSSRVVNYPETVIDLNNPKEEKVELDVEVDYTVLKNKGGIEAEIDIMNIGKNTVKDIYFYLEASDCFDHSLLANSVEGLPVSTADKKDSGYLFNTKQSLDSGDSFFVNFSTECVNFDDTINKCGENHYITIKFFVSEKEVYSKKTSFSFEKSISVKNDSKENETQKPEKKGEKFYKQQIEDFREELGDKKVTKENKAETIFLIEKFIIEGEKIPSIKSEINNIKNQYKIIKLMDLSSESIATYDEIKSLPGTLQNIISGNFTKLLADEAVDYFIKNKIKDRADNIVADSVEELLDYIADYDYMWKKITTWYLDENGY